jgi:hypothetical protein
MELVAKAERMLPENKHTAKRFISLLTTHRL